MFLNEVPEPTPSKMILDQAGGAMILPTVREKFPNAMVYQHFNSSTASLYKCLGEEVWVL